MLPAVGTTPDTSGICGAARKRQLNRIPVYRWPIQRLFREVDCYGESLWSSALLSTATALP